MPGMTTLRAGVDLGGTKIQGEPEHYFVPPYVGHRGWVGVHLNRGLDFNEIAGAIEEAYLTIAPKRLAEEAIRARG
jgi:hypothetical protein